MMGDFGRNQTICARLGKRVEVRKQAAEQTYSHKLNELQVTPRPASLEDQTLITTLNEICSEKIKSMREPSHSTSETCHL
jgi:hypothetical protein